jgi:hypothetical protein
LKLELKKLSKDFFRNLLEQKSSYFLEVSF